MSDLPVFTVADLEAQPALDAATFTNDDAVDLGLLAVALIRERGLNLSVKIVLNGDIAFQARLGDTGPGNDEWLEGKARVVHEYGEPSLLVRRRHEEAGTPFEELADVDHALYKAHGGSMPIRAGGAIVGTITTSGEPDVVDHEVTAEAVRRFLAR